MKVNCDAVLIPALGTADGAVYSEIRTVMWLRLVKEELTSCLLRTYQPQQNSMNRLISRKTISRTAREALLNRCKASLLLVFKAFKRRLTREWDMWSLNWMPWRSSKRYTRAITISVLLLVLLRSFAVCCP